MAGDRTKKASERIRHYRNADGPVISTVNRRIIQEGGLYFKDVDGSGTVSPVNDWRLPARERAAAYVKVLTVPEKLGQLFIAEWRVGIRQKDGTKRDKTGLLDEGTIKKGENIFAEQDLPGTTDALKGWFVRHLIIRDNASPHDLADWHDQLHALAEECTHFIPVQTASNSRNENGEVVFGMNDGAGGFAVWPGTLGIAAAVRGDHIKIVDEFAECIRREWNAVGLRKGYMYMADIVSDPRWQRTYGTFGEDPKLVCRILEHLIFRIQGSEEGPVTDGVAMTVKHFPGGGARENGFDPHYAMGQWNVYPTEGSLERYHLPSFRTAVAHHVSSIMPYYAKPARAKSSPQTVEGEEIELQPYGFAFSRFFLEELLRRRMGFSGYINSDSGVLHSMAWGVEGLDVPERIGFAVSHAGTDIISGSFDPDEAREAYERGRNDYYDTHPVPEGFTREQIVLTETALDRAVTHTLTEMFRLGMFEDPYRDPAAADAVAADPLDRANAALAHRKSVVLLKNDGVLPLTPEKLAGKKVYAEVFHKRQEQADKDTALLKGLLADITLVDTPEQADYAILLLTPSSGAYFHATPGYLELDICDGKIVPDVDAEGRPLPETHEETTLAGAGRIRQIGEALHAKGGKVIANINITLAWQLGNVEPYVDALTAGFDTWPEAVLDVMRGRYAPTGRLPLTLPRGDAVLAVDKNGVCVSPNDVPGYDKDRYMPEALKDENGKAYAYRDTAGNYYELDHGLHYEKDRR